MAFFPGCIKSLAEDSVELMLHCPEEGREGGEVTQTFSKYSF